MSFYLNSDLLSALREQNKFSYDRALGMFASGRRYLVDGNWIEQTPGGCNLTKIKAAPQKTQIRFDSDDSLAAVNDVCSFWQSIVKRSTVNPVLPNECFDRLAQARKTGEPANIFVPWGVRPDFQQQLCGDELSGSSAENSVLQILRDVQDEARSRGLCLKLTIMPADLYATEVNHLAPELARAYFGALRKAVVRSWGDSPFVQVIPWSEIRKREKKSYEKLLCDYTKSKIETLIPDGMMKTSIKSAQNFNPAEPPEAQKEAALRYLRERLCEAAIVEKLLHPIKFSLVDPGKDSRVDGALPRLYIIPENLKFPWLKPSPCG